MIAPKREGAERVVAVLIADTARGPRGLPARWHEMLGGRSVLQHTVDRLRRTSVDEVVIVHADIAAPPPDVAGATLHPTSQALTDAVHRRTVSARKWSPNCWRGGSGGATVYDELIVAGPLLEAIGATGATAALIVGPDWPAVDPGLCEAVIDRYRENPGSNRLTFTQAPPGLAGIVIARDLLEQMHRDRTTFGAMINYNPRAAQADPIAKNVCVQIEPSVRDQRRRFTHDAERCIDPRDREPRSLRDYQQMVIELTPQRPATGPVVPQHHVTIEREPMAFDDARRIIDHAAAVDDMAVTFGGLGDALCHPRWADLARYAIDTGVYGLHLETDLHADPQTLERLAELPIDVLSVRLNADTPETYASLMGGDDLHAVMKRIEWLLNRRRPDGLQWVVPRMVKTTGNVAELESFVDRWTYFAGHALVERPPMPDQAVIDMSQGYRLADGWKRDVLHVLSNGMVVDESDWRGENPVCAVSDIACGL